MQTIKVTIEGLEPGLLMHNPQSMKFEKKARKIGEAHNPKEDAEKSTYRKKNGELFLPATAVFGALINAAKDYKVGKKSASPLVAGTVRIEPFEIGLGTKNYKVDERTVVIQGSRIFRARPNIEKWLAKFNVIVDESFGLTSDRLEPIMKDAGMRVGLLDFSPRHRGPFGRFVVKEFKVSN